MADFSKALILLKSGNKVRRKHWHSFLEYGNYENNSKKELFVTNGQGIKAGHCHFYTPSQEDILAEDWYIKVTNEK